MTRLIIIRGFPGSGKTTIGKRLQAEGHGIFIDHNAILTFIAGISGDDHGIYHEIAQLERAICHKLLTEGNNVIVARGFSSLASVQEYERTALEIGAKIRIIRLNVPQEELIRRVQSPERKLDFNPTIDEAHAKSWMSHNPIQPHELEIVMDNTGPVNEVVKKIISQS